MNIEFYQKDVYGTVLLYVKDPELAIAWKNLTGLKTLTAYTMTAAEQLGITFTEVLPPR